MTPERWQQIRAVYEQAELFSGAERAEYLDRECGADAELRQEVDSLLEAAARAGGEFMDTPAADLLPRAAADEAPRPRTGQRIGAYQITAEIGRGGMGEVYRAVRIDGQFDQEVAIKLVRVGIGSSFVVQRFLQERQILASLNHPQIARLLDGGSTDDGVPYLVMELIEGERVDVYCENRKLSVTDRLQLFLEICAAVQYAHQRLIVHRDIKPTNILVTQDGVPKLLDFGIAKMLDPALQEETTLASPMTPEYASPEQIRGEPITTATDVYSLGVVLYQLLTGRSPYGAGSRTRLELSRAITDTHPQRPSTIVMSPRPGDDKAAAPSGRPGTMTSLREPTPVKLRRRLAGDIDNILLKALRKEPELRYGSVQQFADDVSLHLKGLPVSAAKGSWTYFARKFVARHRAALAATAAVMLTLAAGIVATERQARIAQMERARAQKRFDDVRRFSDSLIFDIHDALEAVPGTTSARNLLLDRAVQYLDSVAKDADGDSELQRELAKGYQRLARVQGDATVSNTGQVSASEASVRKAIALFEAVASANPRNTEDQINLAVAHRRKGLDDIYYPDGRPEIERAMAITGELMRQASPNTKVQMERAVELQGLGMAQDIAGERTQSVESFTKALELVKQVAQQDPAFRGIRESTAKFQVLLGNELAYTGALDKAREQTLAGVAGYQAIVDKGAKPDTVRDLAVSQLRLAKIALMENDVSAASRYFLLAQKAIVPMANAERANLLYQMDRLGIDFELARQRVIEGKFAEGEAGIARAIDGFHKLGSEIDSGPGDSALYAWLGEAEAGQKEYEQALDSYRKAAKAIEGDVQFDDGRTGLVTIYCRMGDTLLKLKRLKEAEAAYRTAQAKAQGIAKDRRDIPAVASFSEIHAGLSSLYLAKSRQTLDADGRRRFHEQACREFVESQEPRSLTPVTLRFNPNNFPAEDPEGVRALSQACGMANVRAGT